MNADEFKEEQFAVINSEAFERLLRDTPFGTYQIVDVGPEAPNGISNDGSWTIDGFRYTYVAEPINVLDRTRYSYIYTRFDKCELLRRQLETCLRERFDVYHELYGLNVNPWLVALHERDPTNGSYAALWQIQKASLVWVFVHTLAALVTLLDNNDLIADFISLIRSLDIFIECGLCQEHWRTSQLPRWNMVRRNHQATRDLPLATSGGTRRNGVDMILLKTHNEIQAGANPNVRLTKAALTAIREDYLNVAKSLITAIAIRAIPTSFLATLNSQQLSEKPYLPDRFSSTLNRREANRKDICDEPHELWAIDLQRKNTLYDSKTNDKRLMKRALLQLEWAKKNLD